jgi:hypothetical protein
MTLRTPGPAIGLVMALGSAAGCGSEEMFLSELGINERSIETSAAARLASTDQALDEPIVVGDIDGDGIPDTIVRTYYGLGDTENDFTVEARVYVVYGGSDVTGSIDLATRPSLTGIGAGFQGQVAAVGDVDGDGLADFLVGVARPGGCGRNLPPPAGTEPQNSGAYLVYGSATRLTGATPIANVGALLRDPAPCTLANNLAPLGDIDGDGKGDFAIGRMTLDVTPGDSFDLYVFYGGARLSGTLDLAAAAAATIRAPRGLHNQSFSAARAGDVDDDGFGDFLVSAGIDSPGASALYDVRLIRGSDRLSGIVALDDIGHTQLPPNNCGRSAALGDLDGDGIEDFFVTSCTFMSMRANDTVVHRVFYGRKDGFPAQLRPEDADAIITTSNGGGTSTLISGDVDGDGVLDLIMADSGLHGENGGVHVMKGHAGVRLSGTVDPVARSFVTYVGQVLRVPMCKPDESPVGCTVGEHVGSGIGFGDLNGDHHPDLLIGASCDIRVPELGTQGSAIGRTYVVSPPVSTNP